jgi:hypothetical protein
LPTRNRRTRHTPRELIGAPTMAVTLASPTPVEISGLTDVLLLYDLRSGFGDAAFYEISLNFEFLLRAQVHHGIEGQVAG